MKKLSGRLTKMSGTAMEVSDAWKLVAIGLFAVWRVGSRYELCVGEDGALFMIIT